MSPLSRTYRGAAAAAGPLLYLSGARRVALGEWVTVTGDGTGSRQGQVIEANDALTAIQLLDETLGLAPAASSVTLRGEIAEVTVGRDLLGRTLNGMGAPLDGLPAPIGEALAPIWGAPLNPAVRARPADFIETGVSAIDGLNTLVRGQKLPIFSGPGLPGLELAARIVAGARPPKEEPFAVLFVGMGITARESRSFVQQIRDAGVLERSVLYLNQTRDPGIERLFAPRVALAQAEYLAFEAGFHVLVVLADLTNYCETLRELATARQEIPGRRGYPGYLYTDLAALLERAGILTGRTGSVTQVPILTMPDDDITHPVPDLTGYITEGQLVLSRELHRRGVTPPIDVLPSLSRLMNAGIGPGRTVPEHRAWANQLYASYAQGREARLMAAIVGENGLAEADRRALEFAGRFETEVLAQRERRSLADTLEAGWRLLDALPPGDLVRLPERVLRERRSGGPGAR
jgi:V/A-type H+-transporting ATPase subunit B